MLVLRDLKALSQPEDPWLRRLLARRTKDILENAGKEYQLHELVTFVVVGPGDSLEALDRQLGFEALAHPVELVEEHATYYELVSVASDDGYGYEVFVPKRDRDLPEALLAFCAQRAAPSPDSPP